MKKLIAFGSLALAALVLSGCTQPEVVVPDEPKKEFASTELVELYTASDSLNYEKEIEDGVTYYWNEGDSDLSEKGQYSVTYTTGKNDSTACYTDSTLEGAIKIISSYTDNAVMDISLTGTCEKFETDASLELAINGNGRYDLLVTAADGKATTEPFAKALQDYLDSMEE